MIFVHPGLQHTSAPCLHAKLVQGHVFTFVRTASLKSSDGPLPRFQDVNEDWLVRKRINIYDLMAPVTRVALSQAAVAVSHVWQTPEDPDPDGEQARIIRDFLPKHPRIELVWIDWCCLPQGDDKTEVEDASFNESLEMVNLLYFGLHVTILLDFLFVGRFWTQLEAFLSYSRSVLLVYSLCRTTPPAPPFSSLGSLLNRQSSLNRFFFNGGDGCPWRTRSGGSARELRRSRTKATKASKSRSC